MENLSVSTFILNNVEKKKIEKNVKRYQELDLIEFSPYDDRFELEGLKNIILKAKENEDDAILIIREVSFATKGFDVKDFFEYIFKVAALDISILLLNGHQLDNITHIQDKLFFIPQIKEFEAFVLLNSVFDAVLAIKDDYPIKSIEEFLNTPILVKALYNTSEFEDNRKEHSETNRCLANKNRERINIIIPFRNVEKYLEDCCRSILNQNHSNFRVFLIDDCSSDNSVQQIPNHPNFIVVKNDVRKFALRNIHEVLIGYDFDDEDIVAIVDGDDALFQKYSLDIINNVYADHENCLVSYGSFVEMNGYKIYKNSYTENEFLNLRTSAWKGSHLKTFKYKVYKEFLTQDADVSSLKNKEGMFYEMTYDMALMFPMFEISGFENTHHVSYPVYSYRLHDSNEHVINRNKQYEVELDIRAKRKLQRWF